MISMYRWTCAIATILVSVHAAQASFELVTVLDRGTKSVHRFDGATGAYLGNFGSGYLISPESMAIDRTRARAYVMDASLGAIRVFNFNTGVHLFDIAPTPGRHQALSVAPNGNLIGGYYSGATWEILDPNAGSLGYLFSSTTLFNPISLASAVHSSGRMIGMIGQIGGNFGQLQILSSASPAGTLLATSVTVGGPGSFSDYQQVAVGESSGMMVSSSGDFMAFTLNSGATGFSSTQVGVNLALRGGVGIGHGNTRYFGSTFNGQAVIERGYQSNSNVFFGLGQFGAGILQTPGQIQVIAAPEPASLAIVGAGLMALIRHRRRK